MPVSIDEFGKTQDGRTVHRFTISHDNGLTCSLLSYGATLQRLLMPDSCGDCRDIVLGYDDVAGYENQQGTYHGATIGRYCNRIAGASFVLGGQTIQLAANDGRNHLHGGICGFDKVIWRGEPAALPEGPAVKFYYTSPDGEEGYPGNLQVQVTYILTGQNTLIIRYEAVSDRDTVINLTNHAYFNLGGQGNGSILSHELQIEADEFTVIDSEAIPTGEIAPVEGTALDFRQPKPIGRDIDADDPMIIAVKGYDHNFVLRKSPVRLAPCATVYEPLSGRVLEILTTLPGVHFYTGNYLQKVVGKAGKTIDYRGGLCLETQLFPDAVHHPNFPSPVFSTGQPFRHETVYKFRI